MLFIRSWHNSIWNTKGNSSSPVCIHRCLDIPIVYFVSNRHWINLFWMLTELKSNNKTIIGKNLHISKHTRNQLDVQTGHECEQVSILIERRWLDLSQETWLWVSVLNICCYATEMRPLAMSVSSSVNGVTSFQATIA